METTGMEQWKDIEGVNGKYLISNLGNVISRYGGNPKKLKPQINSEGYMNVVLTINRKTKVFKVHRLVAAAFIPNPDNKPHVNHKNSIRNDNRLENLEWCTRSENIRHAVKFNDFAQSLRKVVTKEIFAKIMADTRQTYVIAKELNLSHSLVQYYRARYSENFTVKKRAA